LTDTIVTRFLTEKGVSFVVKPHSREVFTCEEAALERGVRLSQIVKSMIGRDPAGELYVMMIPGDRTLKLKRVRSLAGGVRIELLSPEEISNMLSLTVGAISPTQLAGKARFYMDNNLFAEEFVDISSGDPCAGVEVRSQDLERVLGAQRGDIVSTSR
jgi:Cys-tRNA(Pro)/Cys-tRNA(Cys) deacylase